MNSKRTTGTDVFIVGAGPSGLMAACRLVRHGIAVRIIDKKPKPAAYSGALFIQARTLEFLDQMELAEKFLDKGRVPEFISVLHRGRQVFNARISDMGKGLSKFPFVLMLKQEVTEKLLIDYLKKHQVEVEREVELVDLNQDEKMVKVTLLKKDDSKEECSCRYLIGADGAASTVAGLLQISSEVRTKKDPLFIFDGKADFRFIQKKSLTPVKSNTLYFAIHKERIAGFFPLPEGKWRIDGKISGEKKNKKTTPEIIGHNFFGLLGLQGKPGKNDWFSVFHTQTKLAERYCRGRCFLVGDAAHVHTPIGAQGMNTGMQDSCNLSWKLAFVLQGYLPDDELKTYEKERRPVAEKLIRSTDQIFFLVIKENRIYTWFRTAFFVAILKFLNFFKHKKDLKHWFFKMISETEISYKKVIPGAAPVLARGDRLPHFSFTGENGNERISHDCLNGKKFVLISFNSASMKKHIASEKLRRWSDAGLLDVVLVNDLVDPKLSGKYSILVRPDGHICQIFRN